MDQSKSIRTGYFSALSGNITHSGKVVPVYDSFGMGEAPYVILSTQTAVQEPIKGCAAYECTILVDVFTKSDYPTGRGVSEDIAEQIDTIINPENNQDLTITGFQIVGTNKEMDEGLASKNENFYVYRKLLRYRHKLFKL